MACAAASCVLDMQTLHHEERRQFQQLFAAKPQIPALQTDGTVSITDSKSSSSSPSGQVIEQEMQQSPFVTHVTFSSLLHTKKCLENKDVCLCFSAREDGQ